ncbi:phosphoglycerate mutase-like protein [Clavulina sp. PMI_390]|nr:phosphoglycerate mutase-like protein [Clavulina sp. PMI_390]
MDSSDPQPLSISTPQDSVPSLSIDPRHSASPTSLPTTKRYRLREIDLLIIRHGETAENRAGIIQGQMDTLLNDAGRQQAEILAIYLKEQDIRWCLTSDLRRASETAEIIMKYHPGIPIIQSPGIRERYLGLREGQRGGKRANADPIAKKAERDTAEPGSVLEARLHDWWFDSVLPLCWEEVPLDASEPTSPVSPTSSSSHSHNRHPAERDKPRPIAIAVSHGAAIGSLIFNVLLRTSIPRKPHHHHRAPSPPRPPQPPLITPIAHPSIHHALQHDRLTNTSITRIEFRFERDPRSGHKIMRGVRRRRGDGSLVEEMSEQLVAWLTHYGWAGHLFPEGEEEQERHRAATGDATVNVDVEESEGVSGQAEGRASSSMELPRDTSADLGEPNSSPQQPRDGGRQTKRASKWRWRQ